MAFAQQFFILHSSFFIKKSHLLRLMVISGITISSSEIPPCWKVFL